MAQFGVIFCFFFRKIEMIQFHIAQVAFSLAGHIESPREWSQWFQLFPHLRPAKKPESLCQLHD